MNELMSKQYPINFTRHYTGLWQTHINCTKIPLLFENSTKQKIVSTIETIKFEDNLPFEFFKQIISGCIQTHMQSEEGF